MGEVSSVGYVPNIDGLSNVWALRGTIKVLDIPLGRPRTDVVTYDIKDLRYAHYIWTIPVNIIS